MQSDVYLQYLPTTLYNPCSSQHLLPNRSKIAIFIYRVASCNQSFSFGRHNQNKTNALLVSSLLHQCDLSQKKPRMIWSSFVYLCTHIKTERKKQRYNLKNYAGTPQKFSN